MQFVCKRIRLNPMLQLFQMQYQTCYDVIKIHIESLSIKKSSIASETSQESDDEDIPTGAIAIRELLNGALSTPPEETAPITTQTSSNSESETDSKAVCDDVTLPESPVTRTNESSSSSSDDSHKIESCDSNDSSELTPTTSKVFV